MSRHQNPHPRQSFIRFGLPLITLLSSLFISPSILAQQVLRIGSRGEEVRLVQERLRELDLFNRELTSYYGEETAAAVRRFQIDYDLEPDGIVGEETRSLLLNRTYLLSDLPPVPVPSAPNLSIPASATGGNPREEVRRLQQRLLSLGYDPGPIDGIYGSQTRAAVKAFQRNNGLDDDGIVGSRTLAVLNSDRAVAAGQNRNNVRDDRPYVVVIPNPDLSSLRRDLNTISTKFPDPTPRFERSRRGQYIWAGAFADYEVAEARTYLLRDLGFDARVVYF